MIHAFDEDILFDALKQVGSFFDYCINFKNMEPDLFIEKFINSDVSTKLKNGDSEYIYGLCPTEIYIRMADLYTDCVYSNIYPGKTYWIGYAYAYLSWHFNISYKELISKISYKLMDSVYDKMHEMELDRLIEFGEKYIEKSKLKARRELCGISQSDLALVSNVSIKTIQSYEQGAVDISKASVENVIKLSRVLSCSIEDII